MPFSKEALKIIRADEAGELPPAPQSLLDKMQGQAEANDVLSRPGPARDDYRRISAMTQDELLAEFPGVLCANAYDEEDAERENDPEDDPALSRRPHHGDIPSHGRERRRGLEPPPLPQVIRCDF